MKLSKMSSTKNVVLSLYSSMIFFRKIQTFFHIFSLFVKLIWADIKKYFAGKKSLMC